METVPRACSPLATERPLCGCPFCTHSVASFRKRDSRLRGNDVWGVRLRASPRAHRPPRAPRHTGASSPRRRGTVSRQARSAMGNRPPRVLPTTHGAPHSRSTCLHALGRRVPVPRFRPGFTRAKAGARMTFGGRMTFFLGRVTPIARVRPILSSGQPQGWAGLRSGKCA